MCEFELEFEDTYLSEKAKDENCACGDGNKKGAQSPELPEYILAN